MTAINEILRPHGHEVLPEINLKEAKILIVDDEKANVRLLEVILQQAGYTNVHSILDSRQAHEVFTSVYPDLVLLDLAMPHLDGHAVMQQLVPAMDHDPIPILILTADATRSAKHKALQNGAHDFLSKPLDEVEVLLRIRNLLQTRFHSVLLEAQVRERTHELENSQLETLQRLALAAEYRDDDTGLHTRRVGITSGLIAKVMELPETLVRLMRQVAPLHDVGKIGISDAIMLKSGPLTQQEYATMKQHTVIGAQMLSGSSSPWLQLAEEIALSHHERWEGNGYPAGLQGDAIPLSGRIVAVADVFDALTHERPYKPAWPADRAFSEIKSQSGRQFDPEVVEAFFLAMPEMD